MRGWNRSQGGGEQRTTPLDDTEADELRALMDAAPDVISGNGATDGD